MGFHGAGEESSDFIAGDFLCRLQRSEQYFTSSHTSFHFRRHWKGRPQTGQILLGRSRGRVIGSSENMAAICCLASQGPSESWSSHNRNVEMLAGIKVMHNTTSRPSLSTST
jgi:hypothetical protein